MNNEKSRLVGAQVLQVTYPDGDELTKRLSSCAQPVVMAQALPVSHTMSLVSRARGTMSPLPTMASTTVADESPARLLGLAKLLTWTAQDC